MNVICCDRMDNLNRINSFVSALSRKTDSRFTELFEQTLDVFTKLTRERGMYIECASGEVEELLEDYLKRLSVKNHLALCVFVDRLIPVEALKIIKGLKDYSQFWNLLPTNRSDDKIKLCVGFYKKEAGYIFDVDYGARTLLK